MKILTLIFSILLLSLNIYAQGIGINESSSDPDASALLDVNSTNKGILIPRLTEIQITLISNPADGLMVYNIDNGKIYIFRTLSSNWTEIALGSSVIIPVPTIENPSTGKVWMDRNLGASKVASSSTDEEAYGDLYQWGRAKEGHENRSSLTTSTNATTAEPGLGNSWDGLFITEDTNPWDWLTPQDNSLWQGVNGSNNVCPDGFRIPTEAEWEAERSSWSSDDAAGAFASPLKLTAGGGRQRENGSDWNIGSCGYYWSSTVSDPTARHLLFCGFAGMYSNGRAFGFSVRCIKNE